MEFITSEDHQRRAVAFLIKKGGPNPAKREFNSLKINAQRMLRARFDWWVENVNQFNNNWFHGWSHSEHSGRYKECFVFKIKEARLDHRFYGFLINPKSSDPRYQVCILTNHAIKKKWETDTIDLEQVIALNSDPKIRKIIKDYFRRDQ